MPIFVSLPCDMHFSVRARNECFSAPPPLKSLDFWASTNALFLSCYLHRLITAHTSYEQSSADYILTITQQSDCLLKISAYFMQRLCNISLYHPFPQRGSKNKKKEGRRARPDGSAAREIAGWCGKMGQDSHPAKEMPLGWKQDKGLH